MATAITALIWVAVAFLSLGVATGSAVLAYWVVKWFEEDK